MRKFKCFCGSHHFFVNPKTNMVQCWSCKKRFVWEGKWVEFKVIKKAKSYVKNIIHSVFKTPENIIETIGEFRKRLGIKKVKKKKIVEKKEFAVPEKKKYLSKEHYRVKWARVIAALNDVEQIQFNRFQHFGKLRGRDIARVAHSDLKKIGIKTKIYFVKDDEAILELVKNEKDNSK